MSNNELHCPVDVAGEPGRPPAERYRPLDPEHVAHPHGFFAQAKHDNPVFFSDALQSWVVTTYDDVKRVLTDHRHFHAITPCDALEERLDPQAWAILKEGGVWRAPDMSNLDPPDHTRLRKVVAHAFLPESIARLEPAIRRTAADLIDGFIDEGRTDVLRAFTTPFPLIAIMEIFGAARQDMPQVRAWLDSLIGLIFAVPSADRQRALAHDVVDFWSYLTQLTEDRRQAPGSDLVCLLLRSGEVGQPELSVDEVVGMLYLILVAGAETMARFLGNMLYRLLSPRQHWEVLSREPGRIPAVVEEGLRFDTSVFSTWRVAKEDVVLGGRPIAKGSPIQVVLGSANHDEALCPNAEEFNPTRAATTRHLAYGVGAHVCLGAALSRLESKVALEELSRRLNSLRLAPDQEATYDPDVNLRGLRSLVLEWDETGGAAPGDPDAGRRSGVGSRARA